MGKCSGTTLREFGGDGISRAAESCLLQFRYFRDGFVEAVVLQQSERGAGNSFQNSYRYDSVPTLLECETIEDVEVKLKEESAYADAYYDDLSKLLSSWGLPESLPAPDEEVQDAHV